MKAFYYECFWLLLFLFFFMCELIELIFKMRLAGWKQISFLNELLTLKYMQDESVLRLQTGAVINLSIPGECAPHSLPVKSCSAKPGRYQEGAGLMRHSSAEQYMFEEDHIYISSALSSIDPCMPNWPCVWLMLQTPPACSVPSDAASGTAFSTPQGSGWEELSGWYNWPWWLLEVGLMLLLTSSTGRPQWMIEGGERCAVKTSRVSVREMMTGWSCGLDVWLVELEALPWAKSDSDEAKHMIFFFLFSQVWLHFLNIQHP